MEKERLLYLITGTETPRFVNAREMCIVDICLKLINDREEEIDSLKELINLKSQSISVQEETITALKETIKLDDDKIQALESFIDKVGEKVSYIKDKLCKQISEQIHPKQDQKDQLMLVTIAQIECSTQSTKKSGNLHGGIIISSARYVKYLNTIPVFVRTTQIFPLL
eukprot:TRINITY_DN11049_c0_g1_i3.p2 TRINITY_DN11049_c0_g1~~TRINITY_DN11049_c0_g1_i3.p2  ORF type:complete len:168 (-),score=14.45 TRINITY_DN11049_c0_g1_i3:436-939(-)